jgi:peptidoglycan/LPS O-acetylase OafA/YrhL
VAVGATADASGLDRSRDSSHRLAAVTALLRFGTQVGNVGALPRLWVYSTMDLILAIMLGVVLMARGGLLAHPIPVYLGRISFGLYIFHQAVAQGVLLHVDVPWPLRLGLTLALTLCLAALSYVLLERPFLRLKMRFTYVRSAPV